MVIINTIHLSLNQKPYPRKKPQLQFDILACLCLKGKLSKTMIKSTLKGRHLPDIIHAVAKLEKNGYIKIADEKQGRGKKQVYYTITEKGLKLLIISDDNYHPLRFWNPLVGYCHHNDGGLASDKIEEFYQLFIEKYLKYRSYGFSFEFDIFNNMRDKWLREMILNLDKPSPEQKVLEVLAIYPKITFKELVEKIGENKSNTSKVLSTYTFESYKRPTDENEYYMDQNIIGKKHNKKYWDFLLHNTVIVSHNSEGVKTYELSLFGVILVLTLVRYYDMDKLNPGLYYRDILFPDYYDKIASNYQNKLPLIFGKWNLLKKILRIFAAYNFDIILDNKIQLRDTDKLSVVRGGNKELYDGIREIVLQTRQQLGDFANYAIVVFSNYISSKKPNEYEGPVNQDNDYLMNNNVDTQGRPDPQKVYALYKKLTEIMILLNPLEYAFPKSVSLEPEGLEEISHIMEDIFADQITAVYYIHLYYDHGFDTRISQPTKYYSFINHNKDQFPVLARPKSCLLSILQGDKELPSINEWFYNWIQDITNLQKEIYETLKLNI